MIFLGFLGLPGVVARRVDATVLLAFSGVPNFVRLVSLLTKEENLRINLKHSIKSTTTKNYKNKPSKMPLKMAGRLRGPNSNHRFHER